VTTNASRFDDNETAFVNSQVNSEAYAPPLSPLRDNDWKALQALFDREDSDEIEAEINGRLVLMVPEPLWGDEYYAFLREYL
jgi:hypothetical protein